MESVILTRFWMTRWIIVKVVRRHWGQRLLVLQTIEEFEAALKAAIELRYTVS